MQSTAIRKNETPGKSLTLAPPADTDAGKHGVPVELHRLSKSFGERKVLQAIDLRIGAGEFVAIVGRSGCGKSTLLRLIAGLERADAGILELGAGAGKPEIRVMFQDSRLLPWKSVLHNVGLGLARGLGAAASVLRQVGLGERMWEWPAVLSGGQRQRVALARALVHEPQLMLLDEPLGALDALTRIEMQQLVEALWLERGFTAVLVTHDVQEAIALADRVLLIEDGCITLDKRIELPRPRARGSLQFAQLEDAILSKVLRHPASQPDAPPGELPLRRTVKQVTWAI